jgi:hypothetical protein
MTRDEAIRAMLNVLTFIGNDSGSPNEIRTIATVAANDFVRSSPPAPPQGEVEAVAKLARLGITADNRGRNLPTTPKVQKPRSVPRTRPITFPQRPPPVVEIVKIAPSIYAPPLAERRGAALAIVASAYGFCKWPHGDPLTEDFYFCSADAMPGAAYCARHQHIGSRPS